jgi:uncharacterized protein
VNSSRSYTPYIRFTWDEVKHAANLRDHGIDFLDAEKVFSGLTFTYEDDRFAYGERRFVTLGLLVAVPVSIVHTEDADSIHVISFRKATRYETELLFSQIKNELSPAPKSRRRKRPADAGTPGGRPEAHRKGNRQTRVKSRRT